MKQSLHIKMINKPHAYPEDSGAEYEAWGRLILFHQSDKSITILLDTEWDLAFFSDWFVANAQAVHSEKLDPPSYTLSQTQESLTQIISRLREREFKKDEEENEFEWFDYLYQYSTRHNLWNGLMGSRVPNILIGCNNEIGEISMFDDENKWHLNFDMEEFVQEAKQEIVKFLLFWKNVCKSGEVTSRVEAIIQEITKEERQNCC